MNATERYSCSGCETLLQIRIQEKQTVIGWSSQGIRAGYLDTAIITVTCPTCQIRVMNEYIYPDVRDAVRECCQVATALKLRKAAIGIGLERALKLKAHAITQWLPLPLQALYDSDTQWCLVEEVYAHEFQVGPIAMGRLHPTGQCKISGKGAQDFSEVVGSLHEALLLLPFLYGIPTDTGWRPIAASGSPLRVLDTRPYLIPARLPIPPAPPSA